MIQTGCCEEVICPEGTTFLQFVADNTDRDMATLDGKETHHELESITIANGGHVSTTCPTHKIPRYKKKNWSDIKSCEGIKIRQYFEPDIPALAKTILRPITQVNIFCSMQRMLIHSISILTFTDDIGASSNPFKVIVFQSNSKIESYFSAPHRLPTFICQVIFGFTLLVILILEIVCLGHW